MSSTSEALQKQLHTLVYRYYLFADRTEAVSLHKIAFQLENVYNKSAIVSNESVGPEDSRSIIKAYIRRLAVEPPDSQLLYVNFATCFYDFVFRAVTEDVEDVIPGLLEASMIRLWREFESDSPMHHRVTYLIRYAARTFQWAE